MAESVDALDLKSNRGSPSVPVQVWPGAFTKRLAKRQVFFYRFSGITFPDNLDAVLSAKMPIGSFHKQLVKNLLYIISNKNVNLTEKIECMSQRTTIEKLLIFQNMESIKNNLKEFTISFDRQALADYLGVERSAMSAELSKLRNEGILKSEKNKFKLL